MVTDGDMAVPGTALTVIEDEGIFRRRRRKRAPVPLAAIEVPW